MAQLQRLAKTYNFKQYLEFAIREQFVCGLRDSKCQKELLCVAEFTADLALQWVKAAEVARKETEGMQESHKEKEQGTGGIHRIHSAKLECYQCGKPYHSATDCHYKDATYYMCQKTGHLARVCQSRKKKTEPTVKTQSKKSGVHQLQESDADSDGSTNSALHSVFQLGGSGGKFLASVCY